MDSRTGPIATPPRLISSLVTGFNAAANHIYLILFPIALDLLIWLGPHVRVQQAFQGLLNDLINTMTRLGSPDMAASLTELQTLSKSVLEESNLIGALRAIPVGMPSLFAGQPISQTPLGPARLIEAPNLLSAFGLFITFFIVGSLLGALYFNRLASICCGEREYMKLNNLPWQALQSILLALMLFIILIMTVLPVSLVIGIALLISPFIAQLVMMAFVFVVIWLLVPLVFSAHGIFAQRMDVMRSISISVRLVRFFLPGTGLFVVMALLLTEGLNTLWRVPDPGSWMALVGIAGHAFITTGLISASFVYYLGGLRTMQETLQQMAVQQKNA